MKIILKGIEIQAKVGTQDHERTNCQGIFVDIEFEYDAAQAAVSDDLSYAYDYSEVVRKVIRTAKENRYYLLESLSEKILDIFRNDGRTTSAKVTVKKPSALKNIEFVAAESNF
ncbi:MAG TPA: dihydroneopterin aldolase [Clostridiales bacterium]|nr:dihydroneopterin aldolase [Clostridiales bacterium]